MRAAMNENVQQELLVHKVMDKMGKAAPMPSNQQQRGQEGGKLSLTQANDHGDDNICLN